MHTPKQLNPRAAVFIPDKIWPSEVVRNRSFAKPVVGYRNLDRDGRSISDTQHGRIKGRNTTYIGAGNRSGAGFFDSTATTKIVVPGAERAGFAGIDVTCQNLQRLVNARRMVFPAADNTARAFAARYFFDLYIGCDETVLVAWQDLCFFCGLSPGMMPATIPTCKKWLRKVHVNIFDLVEAVVSYSVTKPQFKDASELEVYSRLTGNICPASAADGNELFRFMLKKWF